MKELQTLLTDVQTALAPLVLRQPDETFNIFRLLRRETDEVNLHSRFLADLLNPKGSHGMGDVFLRLFLVHCELTAADFHLDTAFTLRENANIDILIQNDREAIIIENKIGAGDQERQLERYADIVTGRRLRYRIFYLTLTGHVPSSQSSGKLAQREDYHELVRCISYQQHIQNWLTECIQSAVLKPGLRETLVQYQQLIRKMTGNTMFEAEKQEVLKLMRVGQNALQASVIARNWAHVRWHTEFDFWQELRAAIVGDNYSISTEREYTPDLIDSVVHGKRNRNPWYGLVLPKPQYSIPGVTVSFMIERGNERLYYGYRVVSTDDKLRQQVYVDFVAKTAELRIRNTDKWPLVSHSLANINFEVFNSSDTVALANPITRKATIEALWTEIKKFMDKVEAVL